MSQNITLSATDRRDIEHIKPLLLDGKSQLDISITLKKSRETINRKISRWTQTEDFNKWVATAWIDKYQKVDDIEAFRALTKLMCKRMPTRAEIKADVNQTITDVKVLIVDNSTNSIQPPPETDGDTQR